MFRQTNRCINNRLTYTRRHIPQTLISKNDTRFSTEQIKKQQSDLPKRKIDVGGWIINNSPKKVQPYLRLARIDRNIGTWLLLFPCLWSLSIADQFHTIPDPFIGSCFIVGAFVMRGAGCTVNDLWDREIDKKVERTRTRPIASGEITVPQAITFLAGQLAVGLIVLLQLPLITIMSSIPSLLFVAIYPLMKRYTNWPQFILGMTFNWGALIGYGSVMGTFGAPVVLPMYCAGIAWTLVYDTIYAHQDKADDKNVGVKSTALYFGEHSRTVLSLFASVFLVFMVICGINAYHVETASDAISKWPYFAAVVTCFAHMLYQIHAVDYSNPHACFKMFESNRVVGIIMLVGIIATNYLARTNPDQLFLQKKVQNQQHVTNQNSLLSLYNKK
ncbi:4-hydroxybenzoate polyprenyltransferase [Acrasis kona]|uniref:4-hydroxybenzoate polyprenyltransferase, mitochondrial n=1 Tax=Acrasis kona TaxID=1008807 RepID=A0AAW2ZBN7_9EUKA